MNQHTSTIFIFVMMLMNFSFNTTSEVKAHKFYLSLTEIRFNTDNHTIEISMRIFPDDLDLAIEKSTGVNPRILTKYEHESADAWVMQYLEHNFHLWSNGTKIEYAYLGKEAESNAVWCYLEAQYDSPPVNLKVESSLLTDIFEDQKNIVQVYYKEYNRGALLERKQPIENFTISNQ